MAAQAHSPRKEVSLDDINKKLSLANKRKEDYLADEVIAKASNRIAQVNQVSEKSKEKTKLLEQQITSKLANAEAKRNDTTATWVRCGVVSSLSLSLRVVVDVDHHPYIHSSFSLLSQPPHHSDATSITIYQEQVITRCQGFE